MNHSRGNTLSKHELKQRVLVLSLLENINSSRPLYLNTNSQLITSGISIAIAEATLYHKTLADHFLDATNFIPNRSTLEGFEWTDHKIFREVPLDYLQRALATMCYRKKNIETVYKVADFPPNWCSFLQRDKTQGSVSRIGRKALFFKTFNLNC